MLIVDDVITAGTAIRQSMDLLASVGARPVGVALALDRQERGTDTPLSAVQVRSSMRDPHAPDRPSYHESRYGRAAWMQERPPQPPSASFLPQTHLCT